MDDIVTKSEIAEVIHNEANLEAFLPYKLHYVKYLNFV